MLSGSQWLGANPWPRLHASFGLAGESMSPRGRPFPAVRSCNFCGCRAWAALRAALIWPRFHGDAAMVVTRPALWSADFAVWRVLRLAPRRVNDPFDGFDSVLFGAMASAADGCLRFVFAMSPISSRRRMASGRDGNGGSCSAIQASGCGGWMRTTSGSPLLIAAGPVFLWNHFLFFMSYTNPLRC